MKVLDLLCAQGHTFEGWFGSEADFSSQCHHGAVRCPICGDPEVVKKLSAPRLNLGAVCERGSDQSGMESPAGDGQSLVNAWLAFAHEVVTNTDDVGHRFADEARKMHYREIEPRAIRGVASADEARSLQEEGIEVLPLHLPESLKGTLQ